MFLKSFPFYLHIMTRKHILMELQMKNILNVRKCHTEIIILDFKIKLKSDYFQIRK